MPPVNSHATGELPQAVRQNEIFFVTGRELSQRRPQRVSLLADQLAVMNDVVGAAHPVSRGQRDRRKFDSGLLVDGIDELRSG